MINELLQHTLAASRQLVTLDDATINRILIRHGIGFADTPTPNMLAAMSKICRVSTRQIRNTTA